MTRAYWHGHAAVNEALIEEASPKIHSGWFGLLRSAVVLPDATPEVQVVSSVGVRPRAAAGRKCLLPKPKSAQTPLLRNSGIVLPQAGSGGYSVVPRLSTRA
jgi:hypothetical protein